MAKVKHIALFKFRAEVTPEEIEDLFNDILDMTEEIPGLEDYVAGENNSPEGLNQGYTHAFVMTFADAAARDAYLPHPAHERVKLKILALAEAGAVVDFEV
jgi:hypothetical protein